MVNKSKLMKHRYPGVWILNFIGKKKTKKKKTINSFHFSGIFVPIVHLFISGRQALWAAGIYHSLELKPREWTVKELSERHDRTGQDATHGLSDNGGAFCRVRHEWIGIFIIRIRI